MPSGLPRERRPGSRDEDDAGRLPPPGTAGAAAGSALAVGLLRWAGTPAAVARPRAVPSAAAANDRAGGSGS